MFFVGCIFFRNGFSKVDRVVRFSLAAYFHDGNKKFFGLCKGRDCTNRESYHRSSIM